MLFFKALVVSLFIHLMMVVVFVVRLPKIEVAPKPDTYFLGGVLSMRDVMPFMMKGASLNKIADHLPEWTTDITFRRWLHQQQVEKDLLNKAVDVNKVQYKSDLNEFGVSFDDDQENLAHDLGLDVLVEPRRPLKLTE